MSRVIIALDFSSKEETLNFLDKFDEQLFVKVGMELFYKEGSSVLEEIKRRGHKIFLDLKLHDIPNTVHKAAKNIALYDVDMATVHAAGGFEMMKRAKEALGDKTILLAITQLTSTSQEDMQTQQLIKTTLEESVVNYAKLAKSAGCDGVVCSPLEVTILKDNIKEDFHYVTPGIRLVGDDSSDQKRVTTPTQAFINGSTYIVVGRSITQAIEPHKVYQQIKESCEQIYEKY